MSAVLSASRPSSPGAMSGPIHGAVSPVACLTHVPATGRCGNPPQRTEWLPHATLLVTGQPRRICTWRARGSHRRRRAATSAQAGETHRTRSSSEDVSPPSGDSLQQCSRSGFPAGIRGDSHEYSRVSWEAVRCVAGVSSSASSKSFRQFRCTGPCGCQRRELLLWVAAAAATVPAASARIARAADLEDASAIAASVLDARLGKPQWQQEFFAWVMGTGMEQYERVIRPYKEALFGDLQQQAKLHAQSAGGAPYQVLELGIGAGPNIKFYACPEVRVLGMDPNTAMEKYAAAAAEDSGLSEEQFQFQRAAGEGLPLADASVDCVVGSLVMCSVDDVEKAMAEVSRVLKPSGTFYFIEHVAAPEGTSLRTWQALLDPLQQALADGCHLQRDPLPAIKKSGLTQIDAEKPFLDELSVLKPHLIGKATKPRQA